jgi:hypothetical protein
MLHLWVMIVLLTYSCVLLCSMRAEVLYGKFHDQGNAEWMVIRGQLRGHNDKPFGRPTPGRPIGCPGVSRSQGVFGVF